MSRLFGTAWWGTDLGRYRPCSSTYERYASSRLPPIDEAALPGFSFLQDPQGPQDPEGLGRPGDDGPGDDGPADAPATAVTAVTAVTAKVSAALQAHGLALPASFLALMADERLLARIPSVTACEWDVSPSPRKSRHPGSRFSVRFLRDQQDCLFWYVLVGGDDDGKVLCSSIHLDDRHLDNSVDGDVVAEHSVIVAPTFPAFVWRFWMENVLWDLVQTEGPYTPAQQRYLDQLAR